MNAPLPYKLSPVDIMDLRASIRGPRPLDGTEASIAVPFLTWSESDAVWELHHAGRVIGRHARIAVVSSCVRYERIEPGFIARIMNPANTCDEAALDLSTYLARHAEREARAMASQSRLEDAQAASDRALSLKYVAPESVSLADLLKL